VTRIALVAGEASGDLLGAGLARALRELRPDLELEGVVGPAMLAAGVRPVARAEELSVMGLVEVLRHLPRLLGLRRRLRAHWTAHPPTVLVGIDAPDFNLGLETAVRGAGVRTVHYVSPSVWAWRAGRVHTVARAADLVLTLLPFEPAYYAGSGVRAEFVGHPAADVLRPDAPRSAARAALGLPADATVLAVLPGSRSGEVQRVGAAFAAALPAITAGRAGLCVVAPMARPDLARRFRALLDAHAPGVAVQLIEGRSREVLSACDLALVASGTAALETTLLARPMVVGYRVAPLTLWLLRSFRQLRLPFYSLPNILAGRGVVPELLHDQCAAGPVAAAIGHLLDDADARATQVAALTALHADLARGADARAAALVLELAERGR
jgi:lipid-A-disaccharide synthase